MSLDFYLNYFLYKRKGLSDTVFPLKWLILERDRASPKPHPSFLPNPVAR